MAGQIGYHFFFNFIIKIYQRIPAKYKMKVFG